jgi:Protein of unknown function (DUF1479)
MSSLLTRGLRRSSQKNVVLSQRWRKLTTQTKSKKEGDISSVFVSLSGAANSQLPDRFAKIKQDLLNGREDRVEASWKRLLEKLAVEKADVAEKGPNIIPQIDFKDLSTFPAKSFRKSLKKRGVAVIRGVIPEDEARSYKAQTEDYIRDNPWTKGFLSLETICSLE